MVGVNPCIPGTTLRGLMIAMMSRLEAENRAAWQRTSMLCAVVARFSGNAKHPGNITPELFDPYAKRAKRRGMDAEGLERMVIYYCGPGEN